MSEQNVWVCIHLQGILALAGAAQRVPCGRLEPSAGYGVRGEGATPFRIASLV